MDNKSVPFIVHEASLSRMERIIKRLYTILIVTIVLMLASNLAWVWAWCQYDYESCETNVTQDGEGSNIYGNGNNIDGSKNNDKEKNKAEEERQE